MVLAFSKASRRKHHIEEWIDNYGDKEACDEAEPTELHQVVRGTANTGATQDIAGERWRYGEEESHKGAPIIPEWTKSAFIQPNMRDSKLYLPAVVPVNALLVSNIQITHLDKALTHNPEVRHKNT